MPVFHDTQHLYHVLGALFERIRREPDITGQLAQAHLVVRFVFKEPEGAITVDLRREPISFVLGGLDPRVIIEVWETPKSSATYTGA